MSRHYFEVFHIPVLRGRLFTECDTRKSRPVLLIDGSMASGSNGLIHWSAGLSWPKGGPLGERITIGKNLGPPFEDRTRQIIGVVGEVRAAGFGLGPQPMMYVPIAQRTEDLSRMMKSDLPLAWAIRTRTEPTPLIGAIERDLRTASNCLLVGHVRVIAKTLRPVFRKGTDRA